MIATLLFLVFTYACNDWESHADVSGFPSQLAVDTTTLTLSLQFRIP